MPRVFVYGTLRGRKGAIPGQIQGWTLWHLGRFPCITQKEDSIVRGEMINVTSEELAQFDQYEGYRPDGSGLYQRDSVMCYTDDGRATAAHVYWMRPEQMARFDVVEPVESGDWFEYTGRNS